MHDIAEHSPDPTLVVNATGRVTWANEAGHALWGDRLGTLEEVLGDALAAEVFRVGAELGGVRDAREIEVVSPKHGPGRVVVKSRRSGGLIVFLLTGRPTAPEPAPKVDEEVDLDALGRLAGGVAHDFNNLLLAVIGHADLIESDAQATTDIVKSASEIRSAGEQAAELTRELLAFGRRERLRPARTDLRDVVRHAASALQNMTPPSASVTAEVPAVPVYAVVDGPRIEQALINLGRLAIEGMNAGGRIMLKAFRPGPADGVPDNLAACIEVRDSAPAIPAEALPHLFEPFFTSRKLGRGGGLGLASAHGTVYQHGGRIRVLSIEGRGTVFRLCLPVPPIPSLETAPAGRASQGARRGRVLLVEPDAGVRTLVSRVLGNAGFHVTAFADGPGAVRAYQAASGSFTLALVDIKARNGGGYAVCSHILDANPRQRIILTASTTDSLVDLPPGVTTLGKPYLPDDLLQLLAQHLTPVG